MLTQEDNTKMNIKITYEGVEWSHLASNWEHWHTLLIMAMIFRVP